MSEEPYKKPERLPAYLAEHAMTGVFAELRLYRVQYLAKFIGLKGDDLMSLDLGDFGNLSTYVPGKDEEGARANFDDKKERLSQSMLVDLLKRESIAGKYDDPLVTIGEIVSVSEVMVDNYKMTLEKLTD